MICACACVCVSACSDLLSPTGPVLEKPLQVPAFPASTPRGAGILVPVVLRSL